MRRKLELLESGFSAVADRWVGARKDTLQWICAKTESKHSDILLHRPSDPTLLKKTLILGIIMENAAP